MSTNPQELSENAIKSSKRTVDRSLRALMQEMEGENTLLAESALARFQKVLKIYRGIKPLLAVLSTLPLLPSTWRAAIVMFSQALEALAISAPDVSADFKAGKDL